MPTYPIIVLCCCVSYCILQDPEVRRRELVAFLRAPLVAMCEKHAAKLMRSKFAGANVLLEVSTNTPLHTYSFTMPSSNEHLSWRSYLQR
jgi:hypothetical protein